MKHWKKIAKQQAEIIADLNMTLNTYEDHMKGQQDQIDKLNANIDAIAFIVNGGKRPIKFIKYPETITTAGTNTFSSYSIGNNLPLEGYK